MLVAAEVFCVANKCTCLIIYVYMQDYPTLYMQEAKFHLDLSCYYALKCAVKSIVLHK